MDSGRKHLRNNRSLDACPGGLAPIRVNAVCPGVVRTNLWKNMQAQDREAMYETVGNHLLVGRVGEAGEITRAYLSSRRRDIARAKPS
jgi:NAD(P)-dependent dehydrogenase (short-subunit alcohol dehydrogenase family)